MGYFKLGFELGKKVLKDKTKTVTFKPGTKFKGQKTVGEIKADMKLKKAETKLEQTFEKTTKSLKKAVKTAKDIEKKIRGF